MSNDFKSIHEFDFTLICNYFKALKRQGPGSPEITQKAVSFINELSDKARIADIGCGTGGQTMALANYTKGQITGIDLFPDFIELFNKNAIEAHCEDRVKGIVGSMDALPFQEEELDLIWSEGAIYNIGFERGMNEWNKFLKKNGFIAVTEASWFTPERSLRNRRLLDGQLPGNRYDSKKDNANGKSRIYPDSPFHFTGKLLA